MYNLFLQSLCLATIYFTIHVSGLSAGSPARRDIDLSKPAIDEFLDKLLQSDKFDILADKIAEKAVHKIMHFKKSKSDQDVVGIERSQSEAIQNEAVQNEAVQNEAVQNEAVQNETAQKEATQNEAIQNDEKVEAHETTTSNNFETSSNKDRVFKIDTQALIGKYATTTNEEISLNYKRFTNGHGRVKGERTTPRNFDSVENIENNMKRGRGQQYNRKKKNANHGRYIESEETNTRTTDSDISLENHKRNSKERNNRYENQRDKKKREFGDGGYNEKDYRQRNRGENRDIARFDELDDDQLLIDSKRISRISKYDSHDQTGERNYRKRAKTNKPDLNINQDSSESDDVSNKVSFTDNMTTDTHTNMKSREVDTRSIIRKDGNKLYAFQDSPDYDEYHDKLSKLLKSVKEKNERRLNRPSKVEE